MLQYLDSRGLIMFVSDDRSLRLQKHYVKALCLKLNGKCTTHDI